MTRHEYREIKEELRNMNLSKEQCSSFLSLAKQLDLVIVRPEKSFAELFGEE